MASNSKVLQFTSDLLRTAAIACLHSFTLRLRTLCPCVSLRSAQSVAGMTALCCSPLYTCCSAIMCSRSFTAQPHCSLISYDA